MDPVPLREPSSNKLKNDGYSEEDALLQDNDKNSSTGNYYETIMRVACFVPALLSDLTLLVPAAGLALLAYSGYNFNPQDNEIKKGITPILLLHGSGFNESEFVVARYYLNQPKYGSVFSLNLEGILSRDTTKGVDDYAIGIVRETIKKIITLTKCNSVIPIGHSMGGMIAMFYAEYFSEEDQIEVKHVFPIASPIKGSPTLDFLWTYTDIKRNKRNEQMSVSGGKDHKGFREELCNKALYSENNGTRKYYTVYSESDWAIPFEHGKLSEKTEKLAYRMVGHHGIIVLPNTWIWINSKLDNIYLDNVEETGIV